MFRLPVPVWWVIPVVAAIGAILAANAAEATATPVPQPAVQPVTADPNDPTKKRAIVPLAEREALGLAPHTWSGVMHPDVYPKLEEINATIAALNKSVYQRKDGQAFKTLWGIRFRGSVYVQVQVNSMDARHRVLQALSAAEFYQPTLFESTPGLTGYATKSALDKLAGYPDVVAVSLDEQPLPDMEATVFKRQVPVEPDQFDDSPGVESGKAEPEIYAAFDRAERVEVDICLYTDSLPRLSGNGEELRASNRARNEAEVDLSMSVLKDFSAGELWLRSSPGSFITASITKDGLEKLVRNDRVRRVGMPTSCHVVLPREQ